VETISYVTVGTWGEMLAATKEEKKRAATNPGAIIVEGGSGNSLRDSNSQTKGIYGFLNAPPQMRS
jgi:hypothetical protein